MERASLVHGWVKGGQVVYDGMGYTPHTARHTEEGVFVNEPNESATTTEQEETQEEYTPTFRTRQYMEFLRGGWHYQNQDRNLIDHDE